MKGFGPPLAAALADGGDSGRLIAETDWSSTPIGHPSTWSPRLAMIVEAIVRSPFAMHLCYGPDLIQFHNDAYRPVLGTQKYPAIGKPLYETFPVALEQEFIRERFRLPFEQGRSYVTDGDRFIMDRFGWTEETFFRFTYDPFRDDDGSVAGVFTVCMETTREFLSQRRLQTLSELNGYRSPHAEPSDYFAGLIEQLSRQIDTPGAVVFVENDDGAHDVVATAGTATTPTTIDLDGDELHALERDGDRLMIPCSVLGLQFEQHPDWVQAPTNTVLIDCARHVVLLALHPGAGYDDDYQQYIRLVGEAVRSNWLRRRTELEMRAHIEALQDLERARDALLSDVSHELRTPLSLISGTTEELLRHPEMRPEERVELLRISSRNIERLRRLVNSLLSYGRLEAGHFEPRRTPTDLAALTNEVCESFRREFEQAGLGFEVDVDQLPESVEVDPDMWETVVLNLLSNSYKYTLDGSIRVSLRNDGDVIELQVTDTGGGIPADDVEQLFDRFHRVRNQPARVEEGTGIGLALVAAIAEGHDGGVSVTSEVGVGTAITVRIVAAEPTLTPVTGGAHVERMGTALEIDENGTNGAGGANGTGGAARNAEARVLVVDDSEDILQLMTFVLARHWTVLTAGNGSEALAIIGSQPVDLVLTDQIMPVMDGEALVRELHARPGGAPPTVMLTGLGYQPAVADEGLVRHVIQKPFAVADLLATVDELLGSGVVA